MEELLLKLIAGGGGVAITATWAYYLWKIEPRLRALEEAIYTQGRIELLKIAASVTVAKELKTEAHKIISDIDTRHSKLKLK